MNNFEILTLKEKDIRDFAAIRNQLLKKAKGDWVLFLDSDESLSTELKTEIESLDTQDFDGFYIKRKIVFLGKEIGEDKVLRLGKKDKGIWRRKVHEVWHIEGNIGTLENYIIHKTAKDLHSYIEKMNTFSSLHAQENIHEGKKSNILKIIFYPQLKFVQNIFMGRGFVFSMLQSFHSFLAWTKMWEIQKNHDKTF